MKSFLCFSFLLLTLGIAAQTQAQTEAQTQTAAQSPSNILASESRTSVAEASPAPEAAAALPEAPMPERTIGAGELSLIKPALIKPALALEPPHHRFFDKTNLMLHLGVMAGETGDLISTRSILEAGGSEANPVARPLMRAGLGGQIAATYGLGEGSALLSAYLLHRTGHHRLERFAPITAIVVESLATASNIRTRSGMHERH